MDTMKVCDTCHEEKIDSIEYFVKSKGIKPDGTPTTRSKCKKCTDKEAWEKKKSKKEGSTVSTKIKKSPDKKIEAPAPIMDNQLEFTAPMEKIEPIRPNTANQFTDNEVVQLKELLKNYNKFIMPSRITKGERIPRSFNVEVTIFQWLKEQANKENCSTSDIFNSFMRQHLNI